MLCSIGPFNAGPRPVVMNLVIQICQDWLLVPVVANLVRIFLLYHFGTVESSDSKFDHNWGPTFEKCPTKSNLVTRAFSAKSYTRDTDSLHSCTQLRLVQEMACLNHSCKIWLRKHLFTNLIPTMMLQN